MPDKNKDKEPRLYADISFQVERAKQGGAATLVGSGAVESVVAALDNASNPRTISAQNLGHNRTSTVLGTGTVEAVVAGLDSTATRTPLANASERPPAKPDNRGSPNARSGTNAVSATRDPAIRTPSEGMSELVVIVDSDPFAAASLMGPQPGPSKSSGPPPPYHSSRPPPSSRSDGAYCLVCDPSGNLAPSTGSSRPPLSSAPNAVGTPAERNHWSLVPSPVIDVEALTAPEHLQPTPLIGIREGAASEASVHTETAPLPQSDQAAVPHEREHHRVGGRDFPAFDPSRAYPNAPVARPFRVGARTQKISRHDLPSANAMLFRMGMMLCPAAGAALGWVVVSGWLPPWSWPAVAACFITGIVSSLVLLNRAWSSINDGSSSASPMKALLLLAIPVFNVYWLFRVVPGFATEYNAFTERNQIEGRPISRNLILAAMVPILGMVFCWIAIGAVCNAINAIRTSPRSDRPSPYE